MMQSGTRSSTNQSPPSSAEIEQQVREATEAALRGTQDAIARSGGGSNIVPPVPPVPPFLPGLTYTGDPGFDNGIPTQVVDIAMGFFIMCAVIIIGWPLARAFGRRIERRAAEPATLNPQMADQLQRIERAVDAMSVEVERISESQRFIAKLQNASALPAEKR